MAAKSAGRTNFIKLGIAVIDELTGILRDLLEGEIKPTLIEKKVKSSTNLPKLRVDQELLVNKAKTAGYIDFDTALLYTLLRNECPNIIPPTNGWGKEPKPTDINVGDDIERIRLIRNKVIGHISTTFVPDNEFQTVWTEIEAICQRMESHLGSSHNYVKNLQQLDIQSVDEELEKKYIEKLQFMVENEKELTEKIQDLSSKVEKVFEELKTQSEKRKLKTKVNAITKKRKKRNADNLLEMAYQVLDTIVKSITKDSTIEEYLDVCNKVEECGKLIEDKEGLRCLLVIMENFKTITLQFAQVNVDESQKMSILSRFFRLVIEIRKYRGKLEVQKSSLILQMSFQNEDDFIQYQKVVEGGDIEKLVAACLLFEPFLNIFDLRSTDIIIELEDITEQAETPSITSEALFGAQNFLECENCEVRPANHHCSNCDGDLCDKCKDEHLRKNFSKNHYIIPIKLSRKGKEVTYGICTVHNNQKYEFYCNDCKIPICLVCFKETHVHHTIEFVIEAYATRKQALLKQLNEVREVLIPERENMLKNLRENYQAVVEKDNEIENEMIREKSKIISDIEIYLNENRQRVRRDREAIKGIFQECEKSIVSQIRKLNEIQHDLMIKSETKESDSINKFWEEVEDCRDMNIQPDVISFSPATFIDGNINIALNLIRFGTYATTKFSRKGGNEMFDTSMAQTTKTKLIASFSSIASPVYYIDNATPTQIWVSGRNQNIVLLDIRGEKLKEIKTEIENKWPLGLGVMQDGSVIYSDFDNKCIKRVTLDEKHHVYIKTDWHPRGCFVTTSGDVLVSMERSNIQYDIGKICRFGQNGELKLTVGGDVQEKESLFITPDDICENSNGDICVSNWGKRQVTVLFPTGQLKFTYKGHSPSDFFPLGICTDGAGNILVVNQADSNVHMLNQDGLFICFLLTADDGIEDPNPLCVDSEGKLWLAERKSGIIKVYKYRLKEINA